VTIDKLDNKHIDIYNLNIEEIAIDGCHRVGHVLVLPQLVQPTDVRGGADNAS
jgi:hypothetical protein